MRECFPQALLLAAAMSLAVIPEAAAQQADETVYDQALALYQSSAYDESQRLFEDLRARYPRSRKADDAAYYLGRIYAQKGLTQQAETEFRAVAGSQDSNRRVEAAYELGRILSKRREYKAVVELLDPIKKTTGLDREDENLSLLLARTLYNLGIIARKGHQDAEARGRMESAVAVYQVVADNAVQGRNKGAAFAGLGKTHAKLLELAASPEEQQTHRKAAVDAISRALETANANDAKELRALLDQVQAGSQPDPRASLLVTGGTETQVMTPGFRVDLRAGVNLPFADAQRIELDADFKHDDFTLKSFNYTAAERADLSGRLVQRTDRVKGSVAWRAGERDALQSRLKLKADALFAENNTDNSWGVDLSEEIAVPLSPGWRAVFDASGGLSMYPNYVSGGRRLDSASLGAAPQIQWTPTGPLRVSLKYSYELKQYLDAKYDVADPAGSATADKQYQTHAAELALQARLGDWRPSLSYSLTLNKTYNYDVWVAVAPTGSTNDVFVEGYFDYVAHAVKAGLTFERGLFRVDGKGGLELRDFANYPARDELQQLVGELRRDLVLTGALQARAAVWPRADNGFADTSLFLEAAFEKSVSNMTYEKYFATNYFSATVFAGLLLEL